ncbi:MAG: NRDE family protein [Desulfobulbaceae bacterium]|jgi:uncharacterized protein with NRDE domain|nr:NRDE family protein [Desulfobulbaceae bacterium]
MCLIWFSYQKTPGYKLLLAANRDEFFVRKTAPLSWRDDLIAGWDEEGGGTWLAANRHGQIAALTNFRDPARQRNNPPSRGEIIPNWLRSGRSAEVFLSELRRRAERYNPFNLLLFDGERMFFYSNADDRIVPIAVGAHVLTNSFLDADWPKAKRISALMAGIGQAEQAEPRQHETRREVIGLRPSTQTPLKPEPFFAALADRRQPQDTELPRTGVGLDWERMLAPVFITGAAYGTRSSALVAVDADGRIEFYERAYRHKEKTAKSGA